MQNNDVNQTFSITFINETPMILSRKDIQSPTINKAIDFINNDPMCVGLTLNNGINIQAIKEETTCLSSEVKR